MQELLAKFLQEKCGTVPDLAAAASAGAQQAREPLRKAKPSHLIVDAADLLDEVPDLYAYIRDWSQLLQLVQGAMAVAWQWFCQAVETDAVVPNVRLVRFPGTEFARASVSLLRVADVGQFVKIAGTVTRAGPMKVVQAYREFQCDNCQQRFTVRGSPAAGYEFEIPKECASGAIQKSWDAKAKRPKKSKCHSKSFTPLPCSETCMSDFQEVRVQDRIQVSGPGVVPQSLPVVLFGDLVGKVQPGEAAVVEGVVWQRFKAAWPGKRLEVELFIEATHIERLSKDSIGCLEGAPQQASAADRDFREFWQFHHSQDQWAGRAEILRATTPWLCGVPVPKLALLLTLIGGVQAAVPSETGSMVGEDPAVAEEQRWGKYLDATADGAQPPRSSHNAATRPVVSGASKEGNKQPHTRTTPHLLLLGDPGTGKSQLLLAAQELAHRSVRTSGLGTTSAGLTCAAVRDGPDFVLEAGALVLADGGVCCIDEFSTINAHDRASVHEAMEQQTVSVAKAGLQCRLRSQCSVVAAQNCKGGNARGRGASFDCNASIAVNSGLPPPLLSRFDLVVVFSEGGSGAVSLGDKADHILSPADAGAVGQHQQESVASQQPALRGSWTHDRLRAFIAWAKENQLTAAADERATQVLMDYFCVLRRGAADAGGSCGVTVRTLQSLLRLSQAHARLMCHRRVELEDAVAVVVLHRAALQDHVVGADFGIAVGEQNEEAASCGVQLRGLGSLQLNHSTDITSQATYMKHERGLLSWLRSASLGRKPAQLAVADCESLAFRAPLMDSSQASGGCGDASFAAVSWGDNSQFDDSQSSEDGGGPIAMESRLGAAARGSRRLGCRPR